MAKLSVSLGTPSAFKKHFSSPVLLEVFDSPIAGKGLRSLEPIKAGQLLGFYGGQRFASMKEWEESGRTDGRYLFSAGDGSVIDGKFARLGKVNHSCEPNLTVLPAALGSEPVIAFLAKRDIASGEELSLDYLISSDAPDLTKWVCNCGTSKCRGWMYHPDLLKKASPRKSH